MGKNEPARIRSALDQLGAQRIARSCSRAAASGRCVLRRGEVDEIRLFIAPIVVGGSSARDPLEGEGAERIAEATHALRLDVERIGDDVLLSARIRSGSRVHRLVADLGSVVALEATGDGVRLRVGSASRASCARATRSRSTASA